MSKINILWADDEIDHLKPQIIFLESKGYNVIGVTNGQDALERSKDYDIAVVFLDEHMPGLSGLETLTLIKAHNPTLPVVMITKNEEENIMEEAIGGQISDYLIKPVKPNQILLTLKKIIDNKRLVSQKTTSDYQKEFQSIFSELQSGMDFKGWSELYKKLVFWEIELSKSDTAGMRDVMAMQKQEANVEFNKFVINNYLSWLKPDDKNDAPVMSHTLMEEKIFPVIEENVPTIVILIDNLRLDQWKVIQPIINESFKMVSEDTFYSILPTATQYSRNSIFTGLLPLDIEKNYPDKWKNDEEEGGKNMHEEFFLEDYIRKSFQGKLKVAYKKVTNHRSGKELEDNILNYCNNHLTAIVYNFVDMLSHARTEMEVLKELASDESAYRSLTLSWFEHSPLHNALKKLSDKKVNLIFTTDHGTMRVNTPSKCVADKATTTNLRYKNGKNLNYEAKDVFEINDPHKAYLPKPHVSSKYIFAKEDKFLVYPNSYNHYVNYFKNTFQHGGISLEEIIVPVAVYTSK